MSQAIHPTAALADGSTSATGARLWLWASWVLGAAIFAVVIAVALRNGKAREFTVALHHLRPEWALVAAGLQFSTYACDASIWKLVLTRVGYPVSLRTLLPLSVAKLFVGQALPSGGLSGGVMLVRALGKLAVPIDVASAALVINLFGFYAAFASSAIIAAIVFYATHTLSHPILATAVPFSLLVIAIPSSIAWLVQTASSPHPRLRRIRLLTQVLDTLGQAKQIVLDDRGLLASSSALQLATFAADAATLYVMLVAFGSQPPVFDVFAAFILASAAELVGPVPGGLGAFEGGCVLGLHAFGVPFETALLGTMALRGFTFWLPMIHGFLIARRSVAPSRSLARGSLPHADELGADLEPPST